MAVSYIQMVFAIICAILLFIMSKQIYSKDPSYVLNKLYSTGMLLFSIGSIAAAISNIPGAGLIKLGNQIFWWTIIACLLCFFIGSLFVMIGKSCFNKEYLVVYFVILIIPTITLLLPDSINPKDEYGSYIISEFASLIIYPCVAILIIATLIIFLKIRQHSA